MSSKAIIAALSVAVGAVFASTFLYIGFQHNPQGEFFDPRTGVVDWRYAALLFSVWFIGASIVAGVVMTVVRFVYCALRNQLS